MRAIGFGLCGLGLTAGLLVFGAAPASAQTPAEGPVSTATGVAPPASSAPPTPLPIDTAPDEDQDPPPVRDGKIHGMVEAGIGTNGYRHGAVAIDAPLPDGGEIAIAVDSTQVQPARVHKTEHLAATVTPSP